MKAMEKDRARRDRAASRVATAVHLLPLAGLAIAEAAEALNLSAPTAKRDGGYARVWLVKMINDSRE